ncbi:hypothetical protein [Diaphorobacter sp. JS3051]|uniref:hypothetical protein n=1 Tax=Diaphorobacter sp. JS3051 TaxID=2792224 RepID=UPI0018C91DC1|nr:hypothetical protein [Diaphorobacter sp. JS3051]QPN31085.1 hypothetical protein I3K84_20595 [Diaphorobacter sp. JS3051]
MLSPSSLSAPAAGSGWLHEAIARIEADYQRSADTHLIPLPLPAFASAGIDLYLKDESTHPTGSLKHRLARSLFLYALCNGWVREGFHHRGGIERLHRRERGLFRAPAGPALRGGDASAAHRPRRSR